MLLHVIFSDGTTEDLGFDERTDSLGNKYSKYFQDILDEERQSMRWVLFCPQVLTN